MKKFLTVNTFLVIILSTCSILISQLSFGQDSVDNLTADNNPKTNPLNDKLSNLQRLNECIRNYQYYSSNQGPSCIDQYKASQFVEQPKGRPQTVATQPQPVVTQPQTVVTQPQTVVIQPQTVVTQPQTVATQPQTVVTQPQTVVTQPQTVVTQPQTVATQPQTVVTQPQTVVTQPQTVVTQELITDKQGYSEVTQEIIMKAANELQRCNNLTKDHQSCFDKFDSIINFVTEETVVNKFQQLESKPNKQTDIPQSVAIEPVVKSSHKQPGNSNLWNSPKEPSFTDGLYLGVSLDSWSEFNSAYDFDDVGAYASSSSPVSSSPGYSLTLGWRSNSITKFELSLIESSKKQINGDFHDDFTFQKNGVSVKQLINLSPNSKNLSFSVSFGLQVVRSKLTGDYDTYSFSQDYKVEPLAGLRVEYTPQKGTHLLAEFSGFRSSIDGGLENFSRVGITFDI